MRRGTSVPRRRWVAALCLILFVAACGIGIGIGERDRERDGYSKAALHCPPDRPVSRPEPGLLRYCGPVTHAHVDAVEAVLADAGPGAVHTLIMDSTGGSTGDAIRLARLLRQHGTHLHLPVLCLSACAQYVAMGAPSVSFGDRTVLGFHHTALASITYLDGSGGAVEALAREEVRLYRDIGVPAEELLRPLNAMILRCKLGEVNYVDDGRWLGGGPDVLRGVSVRSDYGYVMPEEAWYRRHAGDQLRGRYPSRTRVAAFLEENPDRFGFPLDLRLGGLLMTDVAEEMDLPSC